MRMAHEPALQASTRDKREELAHLTYISGGSVYDLYTCTIRVRIRFAYTALPKPWSRELAQPLLTSTPHQREDGLDSNPREDMDVCKCIVPSRHGGTLNSRRAANPLVRLVAGEERWRPLTLSLGVLPQNWGGTKLNRIVTSMVLKTTANDRRTSSPLP
ncbi:uncharacterized protein TNCV_1146821 [Trichonephila clavipes]|nr:uncharacterized protein TNCV_1146821 [Trichonephila clavipes]